jgi:steroid delta-isomerase
MPTICRLKEENAMSPASIRQVVADYFAATRAMDVEAWLRTFAEDAVTYDPVGGPPVRGHAGLRQFFDSIAQVVEQLSITEEHVYVAGNGAAVKWLGRGVGTNGREVTFEGIDVFEVNAGGKIQTLWGYWDPAPMMTALMT